MPSSTSRGYPYLVPSDPPDIAGSEQNLAAAVDADVTALQQARQVTRTTTANAADSTNVPIVSYDGGTSYTAGSIAFASGLFTPSVAGLYQWSLTVSWPPTSTTHSKWMSVLKNGSEPTTRDGKNTWVYYGSIGNHVLTAGGLTVIAAGDTMQAVVYHTAGSTLTISPLAFSMARVG